MNAIAELSTEQLCWRCDPAHFAFETTAELEDLEEVIGQPRAVEAVRFGIGIARKGYNIFALGPSGMGKRSLIRHSLAEAAGKRPAPDDWCYVHNFAEPHKPKALRLPPGMASALRRRMEEFVEELRTALPAAFESDEYRTSRQNIEEEFQERQQQAFEELRERARKRGLGVLHSPGGLIFAPLKEDGQVMQPAEFQQLPVDKRQQLEKEVEGLQKESQEIFRQLPQWEKERRERMRELNREAANYAVGHLIDQLHQTYNEFPEFVAYLEAVKQDVVENIGDILKLVGGQQEKGATGQGQSQAMAFRPSGQFSSLHRYQVNVLVDNQGLAGAPVVYEDHPTFQNLVGRVEHMAEMGALLTDFKMIKAGALHRANGGYLILDAGKLLVQPYAWEGLKRALRAQQIRIESLGQAFSLISTVSLEPEAIPLEVKVVLLGDRQLYYLLSLYDPQFEELFKVAADFDEQMERNPENDLLYARLIATLARREGLQPLNRGAVARLIEYSARLVGDAERLSTRIREIVDLLGEANHWAANHNHDIVNREDVQRAIDARIFRLDRLREQLQEQILRGTVLIDTEGEVVGQINGLSVLQMGGFAFGRPSRITARVRLGRGEVTDIEREVEMGGPIHSKGVLILFSFLAGRYAVERPLSLGASLVFEQSYGGVEGDSASSAELYALLSAIARVPVRQSLAVTGSVNQRGQIQAIGGVNEKIEGFFEICQKRGLTGGQGVLIPVSNVKHLMLRQEVVRAVAAGMFHIYSVETVDQGIELLTGIAAGELDENGKYPLDSINGRVQRRLDELAEKRQEFGKSTEQEARQ